MSKASKEADKPVTIAILAGEASGDQLGAHLIQALSSRFEHVRFVGMGGDLMRRQGFDSWYDMDMLSVMGFSEVIKRLPHLLKLRHQLTKRLVELKPDVFIGIDAPDFNLGLERKLKRQGLAVIHYVSPSIWAWREKRVLKIGQAAHRILCLFPMEPPIYQHYHIEASFVGHPLAERFPLDPPAKAPIKQDLGLNPTRPLLLILPGSRQSEIKRLAPIFLAAATKIQAQEPGIQMAMASSNQRNHALMQGLIDTSSELDIKLVRGHAHELMQASDVIMLASGTATLEAMLAKTPMVVGYKVSAPSYWLARMLRMLKTDIYALPNILDRADNPEAQILAPEHMQSEFNAEHVSQSVIALLHDLPRREMIRRRYRQLHQKLLGSGSQNQADRAAQQVLEVMARQHG